MDILETFLIVAAIAGVLALFLLLVEVQKKMLRRGAAQDSSPAPKMMVGDYIRSFVSRDNLFVIAIALLLIVFVIFMRHGLFLLDYF